MKLVKIDDHWINPDRVICVYSNKAKNDGDLWTCIECGGSYYIVNCSVDEVAALLRGDIKEKPSHGHSCPDCDDVSRETPNLRHDFVTETYNDGFLAGQRKQREGKLKTETMHHLKDWEYAILTDEVKWSRQFIEELLRHLVDCRDIPRERLKALQECYKSGPPSGTHA